MPDKKSGGFWSLETLKTIVYAVVIALVVRTVAYEPFNIPSASMVPTLLVGDYLFVSKFSYGYSRHSLPLSLPLIPGRLFMTEPDRGDVAVFKVMVEDPLTRKKELKDYIKRIIGLPGDTIQMRGGRLFINGKIVERRKIEDFLYRDESGPIAMVEQYVETLPNGRQHRILELASDQGRLDDTPVYTVPEGHYFAMGDNRDNSEDSRVLGGVGFVPAERLVGRADILFFSTNGSASFLQFWRWPSAIRFRRIFQSIE